ncbi:MAG: transposase [Pirellulales bacterium]|nr:transposase [Pirellulales bacterium]
MARPIRVEYEGAVYHVTARGNECRAIYRDQADQSRFLETLGDACGRFGLVVHDFCLTPSHIHWVFRPIAGQVASYVEQVAKMSHKK